MKANTFKVGDVVVLISDGAIRYTIVSLYGNANSYSICSYQDNSTAAISEISIPIVALKKQASGRRGHAY